MSNETCRWAEIDEALDLIEEGDVATLVRLFRWCEGMPVEPDGPDGRWGRVNATSFSRRAGIARHRFIKWLELHPPEPAIKETA